MASPLFASSRMTILLLSVLEIIYLIMIAVAAGMEKLNTLTALASVFAALVIIIFIFVTRLNLKLIVVHLLMNTGLFILSLLLILESLGHIELSIAEETYYHIPLMLMFDLTDDEVCIKAMYSTACVLTGLLALSVGVYMATWRKGRRNF
ncbi:hypothetical protein H696_01083 [Fonticula alba]|uniref:Uncharacterized protein n=1 Tax=Fonticula alba TaxID=691883 RepID=A0A058ZDX8_FONAL|nr:hypothetical protein H696_01083 [Fonticula alba]KCV71667.1 hypothetical protein H696_01083 [Fonticula alba]|eukprot:XP_009493245.1 hypothetical protein H696_01083 [Fonticula alba]